MLFVKTCLVVFAFLSNCPLDIHLSILRTVCLKPCPQHNCIIVVFNPHQQHFGDVVSKFGFFPDMKSTFGNRSWKNGETPGVKCRNVMNLYESRTPCYTCSIGIYNMTTIVAILISFKDHLFLSLRQIESKLGLRDRGNMDIQNCLNHSILISNLAPMATILIFFQKA